MLPPPFFSSFLPCPFSHLPSSAPVLWSPSGAECASFLCIFDDVYMVPIKTSNFGKVVCSSMSPFFLSVAFATF